MEYGTESSNHMKFFTIFDGNLVTREPEGTAETTMRTTSTGRDVWEKTHNFVSGMLTGGGIVVKEFDKKKVPEIQVILDDEGMVQIPMYLLKNIGYVTPNIDKDQPLKFRTYKTKKGSVVLELSQNGAKLENHFVDWNEVDGKWVPTYKNGCPAPTHDDIDGWDYRDHDKFLKKVVMEFFTDGFAPASDPVAVVQEALGGTVVEDETDVPF